MLQYHYIRQKSKQCSAACCEAVVHFFYPSLSVETNYSSFFDLVEFLNKYSIICNVYTKRIGYLKKDNLDQIHQKISNLQFVQIEQSLKCKYNAFFRRGNDLHYSFSYEEIVKQAMRNNEAMWGDFDVSILFEQNKEKGHSLLIRGLTEQNKVLVCDPQRNKKQFEYEIDFDLFRSAIVRLFVLRRKKEKQFNLLTTYPFYTREQLKRTFTPKVRQRWECKGLFNTLKDIPKHFKELWLDHEFSLRKENRINYEQQKSKDEIARNIERYNEWWLQDETINDKNAIFQKETRLHPYIPFALYKTSSSGSYQASPTYFSETEYITHTLSWLKWLNSDNLLKIKKSAFIREITLGRGKMVSRPFGLTEFVISSAFPMNTILQKLVDNQPYDFIWGFSSTLYQLALQAKRSNIIPKVSFLISTGGTLFSSWKKVIEQVFNQPLLEMYGSAELGCATIQCQYGNLHWNLNLSVPYIQKDDSIAEPYGKKGRLIVKTLHNWTSRLYNHDTGDTIEFADSNTHCKCGSSYPIVKNIIGRTTYWLKKSDGTILTDTLWSSNRFLSFLKNDVIKALQYYQYDNGDVDVRYVPGKAWDEEKILRFLNRIDTKMKFALKRFDDIRQLTRNGKFHIVERESFE